MNLNLIKKFYDPTGALGALGGNPASLAVGATAAGLQNALGLIQLISGGKKTKKLLGQLEGYKTPKEIFKIMQATESMQGGFDPSTLAYLTGQSDRAFASTLGAATRLGADPNQLATAFDRRVQESMKIGWENHLENLKNFDKYISALGLMADNAAAEQKSRQDIIKNKLQAASADKVSGLQNIGSGLNAGIGVASSAATMNLYTQQQKQITDLIKALTAAPGTLSNVTAPGPQSTGLGVTGWE